MEPTSPFANANVPILGQPTLIGAIVVVTFICPCEARQAIQATVGATAQCPACKKRWAVNAEVKLGLGPAAGVPNES